MLSYDNTVPSQAWFGKLISDIAQMKNVELETADIREAIGASVNGRNHKQITTDVQTWLLGLPKDETI